MCGICGIIRFDHQTVSQAPLKSMMQIMKHRGPDDEGMFIDENVGLGFVRLSIIDLSPAGHQPMLSDDKRYIMVFNGEIYNYIELREELIKKGHHFNTQTDSEVLLKSYIEWGESCLNRFNGMWAFMIFDRQLNKCFVARDRFGIKPFYYILNENFFAFCSEIPPLISILDHKPKPDYQSIFDFLVFNRTDQTESTFFFEVKKLQHAQQLSITNSILSTKKWYNLRERVLSTDAFKTPLEFKELLSSSIGLRMRSDVPVGVCLSGGLDSSSIVSVLLMDYYIKDLKTFSAIYQKGQFGDETEFIQEYEPFLQNMFYTTPDASSLKNDLHEFIIAHGEPIPATGPYAQYKVMKLAKNNVVVTLDGQGADEMLAGYPYFFGYYFKELIKKGHLGRLCKQIFKYITLHRSLIGIQSLIYFLLSAKIRIKLSIINKGYLNKEFINKYKGRTAISSHLHESESLNDALIDHFEYKLEHLLKWEDRNSMWFSIEARVPYLDYRLVEKILASPSELKIKNGMTKTLLRESMKGILPEKIRIRIDKIGFGTPQAEWFRTEQWQKIVIDILKSESFKNRNLIDANKAIEQYNKHLNGKIDIAQEIWKWVHLELWFRQFID